MPDNICFGSLPLKEELEQSLAAGKGMSSGQDRKYRVLDLRLPETRWPDERRSRNKMGWWEESLQTSESMRHVFEMCC